MPQLRPSTRIRLGEVVRSKRDERSRAQLVTEFNAGGLECDESGIRRLELGESTPLNRDLEKREKLIELLKIDWENEVLKPPKPQSLYTYCILPNCPSHSLSSPRSGKVIITPEFIDRIDENSIFCRFCEKSRLVKECPDCDEPINTRIRLTCPACGESYVDLPERLKRLSGRQLANACRLHNEENQRIRAQTEDRDP